MEEQRRVALAKIQEREMLEKPLVEKLLAEDSKKKESSETKEDKGPGPLYVTRKRLVELGHWTNDPFVKKVSSSRQTVDPSTFNTRFTFGTYVRIWSICMRVSENRKVVYIFCGWIEDGCRTDAVNSVENPYACVHARIKSAHVLAHA